MLDSSLAVPTGDCSVSERFFSTRVVVFQQCLKLKLQRPSEPARGAMPTPSSPSSRERETREAPDTALLSKPETYGSFAASLPGATSRDASSILPGSPTYGSGLSSSPFLNTPERAAYARGRSMAAAVAAEAEDAHSDQRARVEAFAADLARVVRQPSDAMYAATGREDPTAAMLREFKRALEAGDGHDARERLSGATPGALLDAGTETRARRTRGYGSAETLRDEEEEEEEDEEEEDETVEPDAFSDGPTGSNDERNKSPSRVPTQTRVEELEALTKPILAGSRVRRAGYGSTARERKRESDEALPSERGESDEESADRKASPLALDPALDDSKIRDLRRSAADILGDTPDIATVAASPGRASARMRRRARARTDPGSTRDDDAEESPSFTSFANASSDDVSLSPEKKNEHERELLYKIQCGKCSCMLKIPHDVVVFRCPRCASKLRAPAMHASPSSDVRRAAGAISFGFENQKPSSRKRDQTRGAGKNVSNEKQKQKRSAFDEELFSLRAAREALERHVAFSKSLEGVVGELAKRVPRVAA